MSHRTHTQGQRRFWAREQFDSVGMEWKALEKSSPNTQRQVLAIASEDQPPSHFVGPNDIQHCTAESSGNTGAGPAMCSERCTRGMAGQQPA